MSREKQIEEMAFNLIMATSPLGVKDLTKQFDYNAVAKDLYELYGWRKQIEGEWVKKHRRRGGFETVTGVDSMGGTHTITIDTRCEYDDLYCSICGKQAADNFLNYCPNCGAKMKDQIMSREQTELERNEISEILAQNFKINDEQYDASDFEWAAHCLQMAGYRKQGENVVELPCKVGDTVYCIWQYSDFCNTDLPVIEESKVTAFVIDEGEVKIIPENYAEKTDSWYRLRAVAFNNDDAEKVLAKMKGGVGK